MADNEEPKVDPELPTPPDANAGSINARELETEMSKSYLDYAMSVIVSRALPDVRDGLKPVHRRVLYTMHQMGLRPGSRFRKSAAIVGDVLGKLHPHGDIAVYDSLVRMAQDFSMRYPLVKGQGNFGSMDGDSAAAMRYTEAKMAPISEAMLADIEKETIDFMPNYDGTTTEPVVLPSRVPNLLLNGSLGIAVGMATNIPPHNLGEVVDGTMHLIDNPEASLEELMEFIKGPDFPTGGTIYNVDEIKAAYGPTGKGAIAIRAVAEIEEGGKGDYQIIVSEIPYQVNKASLIERMADLVRDKKIMGISDIRDESDKDGVRIVIDLKKDAYPKKILNQLYKLTAMQTVFHVNMIALVDGIQPRTLSLKNILDEFIEHRRKVIVRRTEFELGKAKERAHILEGLIKAIKNIDEVIATIKKSRSSDDARANLIKKFKFSEPQANAILAMQLRTLAGLERQRIEDELMELSQTIKGLEELLASPAKILGVIKTELAELKERFGDPRRTKVVAHAVGGFSEEDLIPNEDVIVTITLGGYIKRVPSNIYRSQGRGGKGVVGMTTKEEDLVEHLIGAKNHDGILLFTDRGRVFQTKVYEIPASSRIAKGQAVQNFIQVAPDEKVTAIITLTGETIGSYLLMATKNGTVKKTAIKDFANVRRVGLRAINLDPGDALKWVKVTSGKDDIIMASMNGQALRMGEGEIRAMGRTARGVRGLRLRKGDEVVGMDVVVPGGELLVIMENGYGKRTVLDQFDRHHRGGIGIRAGRVTDKTGAVIDVRVIGSTEGDLVVISRQGQIIRLPLKSISLIGRDTQGVRVMRMAASDTVSSVASIEAETEELPEVSDSIETPAAESKTAGSEVKPVKAKTTPKQGKKK